MAFKSSILKDITKATLLNIIIFCSTLEYGTTQDYGNNVPCSSSSGYKVVTKTFRNKTHTFKVNKTEPLPGNNNPCPNADASASGSGSIPSGNGQVVVSNKDCSDQLPTCPPTQGSPLEIGTNKDGAFVITGNAGPAVQWRYIQKEEVTACLKETTQGGMEPGNIPQYICRANINSNWMLGKIAFDKNNCDFTCDANAGLLAIKHPITNDKSTQILMYNESALNWVKESGDGGLPGNIINAGQNGEIVPICRHVDAGGNTYIGRLMGESKQCSFLKGEQGSTETTNVEVLTSVPVAKSCKTQAQECPPDAAGDPVEIGTAKNGAFSTTGQAGGNVIWRTVTNENVKACLKATKPSGMEDNVPQFVCRTNYNSFWVPGRIDFNERHCEFTCDIGGGYAAIKVPIENDQNTQILMDPNSAMDWVKPGADGTLPSNSIKGGQNLNGVVAPLCRHTDANGNTYIGKFLGDYKNCWFLKGDLETRASDGIDILASTEIDKDKSCPEQSSSCSGQMDDPASLAEYKDGKIQITGQTEPQVKWKEVLKKEIIACIKGTSALGTEPGPLFQYLCRAFYNYEWIPGKLALEDSPCNAACEILIGNSITKVPFNDDNKIQVLYYPRDVVNWAKVPADTDTDFENMIVGGRNTNRDPIPMCRFSDGGGNNFIGHFAVSHSTCWYQSGTKVLVGSGDKVEVLIQGKTLTSGESKGKSNCVDQSLTCPAVVGIPVEVGSIKNGIFSKIGYASNDLQWRSVEKTQVAACLKETTPSGQESGQVTQYICRAMFKTFWVPGKVSFGENSCEFTCDIGASFKAIRTPIDNDKNTQILMYPKTALTWGKLASFPSPPSGMINGGQNVNGDEAPLCRVRNDEGNTYIGKYLPAYRTCWYLSGEKEVSENRPSNIDILISADAAKSCPEQKATCSSSTGESVEIGIYKDGSSKTSDKTAGELKWKEVKPDEITACLKTTTESGTEPGPVPQYICRAFYKSQWVPGKLAFNNNPCDTACVFPAGAEVAKLGFENGNRIQVLSYTPGSVTWNPSTTSLENFIIGGKSQNGGMIPLCRFNDGKGSKYIGQLALGFGTCWYVEGTKLSIGSNKNNIEILMLGQADASGLAKACPAPLPSCPQETGFPVELGSKTNGISGTVPGIQWRYVQREDIKACVKETTASGVDKEKRQSYLCRSFFNSYWVPGRLVVDPNSCDFTCDITADGKVLKLPVGEKNTQILMYKPEVLEWTKPRQTDFTSASTAENTMLIGGHTIHGELVGLCRLKDRKGNIYLGIFNGNACSYSSADGEEGEWEEEETEVIFTVIHKPKNDNCQTQTSTCETGKRVPVQIGISKNGKFEITGKAGNELQWRYVQKNEMTACLKQTSASGMEANNVLQYACRTFYQNLWIPGIVRYVENNCEFKCEIGVKNKVIKVPIENDQNTQLLMFSKTAVKWGKLSSFPSLPGNMIYGGQYINGEPAPLCRYVENDGTIHLGKYLPYHHNCWFPIGDIENSGSKSSNLEIPFSANSVPDNAQSPANSEVQVNSTSEGNCNFQVSNCEPGRRIPVEIGTVSANDNRFQVKSKSGSELQWRYVEKHEVRACLKQTRPAGTEPNNVPQYICRTYYENKWIPGKLRNVEHYCEYTCDIGAAYKMHRVPVDADHQTQLLMFTEESILWAKLDKYPQNFPNGMINGGPNINGLDHPLCRYQKDDGTVYNGKFLPEHRSCWIPIDDREDAETKSSNIELLLSATPIKCEKKVCQHTSGMPVVTGGLENGNFVAKANAGNNLRWEPVNDTEVLSCLQQTTPSGTEANNVPIYICRIFRRDKEWWMVGKMYYDENKCEFTCNVGTAYKVDNYPVLNDAHTQILMYHPSAISWRKLSSLPSLPDKVIIGGRNIGGHLTPICRTASGHLGQYMPPQRTCWYTTYDKELSDANSNIEIMIEGKDNAQSPANSQVQVNSASGDIRKSSTRTDAQVGGSSSGGGNIPHGKCEGGEAGAAVGDMRNNVFKQTFGDAPNVKWRYLNRNNVKSCLLAQASAGKLREGLPTYFCRVNIPGSYALGIIQFDKSASSFKCEVPERGETKLSYYEVGGNNRVDLLTYPESAIKWITYHESKDYDNIILPGSFEGKAAPYCRIRGGDDDVYLGKLSVGGGGFCYHTKKGKQDHTTGGGGIGLDLLAPNIGAAKSYTRTNAQVGGSSSGGGGNIPQGKCEGVQVDAAVGDMRNNVFKQTFGDAPNVKWTYLNRNNVKGCLLAQASAGKQLEGFPTYFCRVDVPGSYALGLIQFDKSASNFKCEVPERMTEKLSYYEVGGNNRVDLLTYPESAITWIPYHESKDYDNLILPGSFEGKAAPYCRVRGGDDVSLGKLSAGGFCYVTLKGKQNHMTVGPFAHLDLLAPNIDAAKSRPR